MNDAEIKNYLSNPNTTQLNGILFRVNYSGLRDSIPDEWLADEITKINAQYKPQFFNLLLKISKLLEKNSNLKSNITIDYEGVKSIFLKPWETKVFNFNNLNQLIILSDTLLIEIELLNENTFELKLFSLDTSILAPLKSEISTLNSSNPTIFSSPEEISCRNTKTNELYIQNIFNLLMEDFCSFGRTFTILSGLNIQLKVMIFGLIKKSNHALFLNDDSLYIGAISLMSLLVENRLAHIYEMQNSVYHDDKTLGQLVRELNSQGHLNGIETPLNNFVDIRNNIIHYHRRTFNIYNSFIESIKYLGQFIGWCKDNGRL